MLVAHQKTVCTSVNGSFGLIQTHYRCRLCENDCGSQVRKKRKEERYRKIPFQKDFKTHIMTEGHLKKKIE